MCLSMPPGMRSRTSLGYPRQERDLDRTTVWGRERNFTGEVFWGAGIFVSTVGLDEAVVRAYIRQQEQTDDHYDR